MTCTCRYLCCLLLCWAASGQASEHSQPVHLYRGEVLFESLQGKNLDALLRLASTSTPTTTDLSETRLRLAFGISDINTDVTAGAAASSKTAQQQYHDAFQLANYYFNRKQPTLALRTLDSIQGEPDTGIGTDINYLRALANISIGRFRAAVDILDTLPENAPQAEYIQYNLAIAELQSGRQQQAISRLSTLGQIESSHTEMLALRDMANLRLGFYYLEHGRPELAKASFSRIALQGPFTDQALLGTGWASFSKGKIDRAIVAWTMLHQKQALNSTVIEAKMALPYAYSKLGAHGKAANLYAHAIDIFEVELASLDTSIEAIKSGALSQTIVEQSVGAGDDWSIGMANRSPQQPVFYLPLLLSDDEFRRAANTLFELALVRRRVERAQHTAAATIELGEASKQHYRKNLPASEKELATVYERIQRIVPDTTQQPSAELRTLQSAYQDYLQIRDATKDYFQQLPVHVSELKKLSKQLERLNAQLTKVIARAGDHMNVVAVNLLNQQRLQLQSYHNSALFALAESYDFATGKTQ